MRRWTGGVNSQLRVGDPRRCLRDWRNHTHTTYRPKKLDQRPLWKNKKTDITRVFCYISLKKKRERHPRLESRREESWNLLRRNSSLHKGSSRVKFIHSVSRCDYPKSILCFFNLLRSTVCRLFFLLRTEGGGP